MDDLAKELFKAELAIPGVYVAVLKLYSGGGGGFSGWVAAAFACWALALAATLHGLFPQNTTFSKARSNGSGNRLGQKG